MLIHSENRTARAPGPTGVELIRSVIQMRRDRIEFIEAAWRQYGDLVRLRLGKGLLFLASKPAYARHILCDNRQNYTKGIGLTDAAPLLGSGLLTGEGAHWATYRSLLQPAFHTSRLEALSAAATRATEDAIKRWDAHRRDGKPLDISIEMARLTLSILGMALFGAEFDCVEEMQRDLSCLSDWATRRMMSLLKPPLGWRTPGNWKARQALLRLEARVHELVRRHPSETSFACPDFVDLLQRGEADGKSLRDEILTILLAGHDTTAAALTWSWYLLAKHPEAGDRLRRETDNVLRGRPPVSTDLPRLSCAREIVSEALRLYPPVWVIPRRAIRADRLGTYEIPSGSEVLVSVWSIHRHPAYWRDADRFIPERFRHESQHPGGQPAYIPFGAGPRSCIAGRFGLYEAVHVLTQVSQEYHLELAPGIQVRPEGSLTLRPHGGLPMIVKSARAAFPQARRSYTMQPASMI